MSERAAQGRGSTPWAIAAVLILGLGAWLRWQTLSSIPSFLGPGDPAIYFGMARGVLREGAPVQDFLHHYLTRPHEIRHLEDYYEPAFGYLLAAAMALFGRTPQAAAGLSFVAGTLVMLFAGLLARRRGMAAVTAAMAVVALEPWSIYYSGVLMKEAVIACATLAALWGTARLVRGGGSTARVGVLAAGIAFAAGLLQYESLPILLAASGAMLLLHRRPALAPFALASLLLVGALAAVTWRLLGVPISAKLLFIAGVNPGDPEGHAIAALHRSTLLPLGYIAQAVFTNWYPLLLILGLRGLALAGAPAVERPWVLAYLVLHVWLHGIPIDLWSRDFIVLTALLAAPAGEALVSWRSWATRPGAGALAWGANAYVWLTPLALSLLAAHVPGFERVPAWARFAGMLPPAALVGWGARRLLAGGRATPVAAVTSLLFAASLVGQYWLALPYPTIRLNPQFPDYEIERARRQRASEWMRAQVPRGNVLAEHAEEVAYYSGFPAADITDDFRPDSFAALMRRYPFEYLLAPAVLVPDRLPAPFSLELVGTHEGYRLYRVRVGSGPARAP